MGKKLNFKNCNKRVVFTTLVAFFGTSPLAIAAICDSVVYADQDVTSADTVTVELSSSCMMSATVLSPHTKTISNGTLDSDIGTTSIKTVCNDPFGYAISAVGYNTSSGVEGDTKLHNSTYDTEYIETGIATSGATSAWAMKVSPVAGDYTPTIISPFADAYGVSQYAAVPSTRTKIAHFTGAVGNIDGSTINTTYRAYVSPTQAAGTYNGGVKYTLSHPDNAPDGLGSITYLQQMTPAVCENSRRMEMANLVDSRDGKSYNVAKLPDGNCWMVENLRFGGVNASGEAITLDSNNSDLVSGVTFNLTTSTPTGKPYDTSNSWTDTNVASEYYPDDSKVNDAYAGNQYYGYYYNWYAAVAGTVSGSAQAEATGSICPRGWTLPVNSTTPGTGKNASFANLLWKSGVIANITDNSAYATDGFNKLSQAPLSFLRAGYHDASGTGVANRGRNGYYWSRSSSSTTNAYNLLFNSSNVHPRNSSSKASGFTVRCVAK